MNTELCQLLGLKTPIVLAPMGGAGPRLTAAVSNAGALGTIALWRSYAQKLRQGVEAVRALTSRPFMVNLNTAFPHLDLIEACLKLEVPLISLFWGVSRPAIERAKSNGAKVMVTIGSSMEAAEAVEAGADVIVAQGWEAGGHVRGQVATMALVPAVVDTVGPVPVIAAGGISDGRGMAAALALGAVGVWVGTRFLASEEAAIHREYQQRLLAAGDDDTFYSKDLFDYTWPDAPHRALKNSTYRLWVEAGQANPGSRPHEGQVIGASGEKVDLLRYQCRTPLADDAGDIEAMSMWAG